MIKIKNGSKSFRTVFYFGSSDIELFFALMHNFQWNVRRNASAVGENAWSIRENAWEAGETHFRIIIYHVVPKTI